MQERDLWSNRKPHKLDESMSRTSLCLELEAKSDLNELSKITYLALIPCSINGVSAVSYVSSGRSLSNSFDT